MRNSIKNNKKNSKTIDIELDLLKQENAELKAKIQWYEEQFRLSQKQRFGSSSEKVDINQISFFDELENTVDPKEEEPANETITYTRKKQVGKRDTDLEGLPEKVIEYDLEDKSCPECNHEMHEMGTEERREVEIIPAQAIVVRHVQKKYSCRKCEKENIKTPIVKASMPKPPISGSLASSSAIAFIMGQKYSESLPLYRQEKYFKSLGFEISRQTMANWMMKSSEDWLSIIYDRMKERLIQEDILHADETTLQVLKEEGRTAENKSYMWLYRTGRTENSVVLYEYQTTRASKVPKNFLAGFKGYLQTDGYQGYNAVSDVQLVGCWAHARRYFHNAIEAAPPDSVQHSFALQGLDYCNKLFAIEKRATEDGLSVEERHEYRASHSAAILEEMYVWLKALRPRVLPKSSLGTAVTYSINQWAHLSVFLQDGRLELSNNRAERSIKPFVIGRKNWMFSATPRGAKASSIIYSIIETAKENGLVPFEYLKFLFEQMPNVDIENPEVIDSLLPWANLPDKCLVPKSNKQKQRR